MCPEVYQAFDAILGRSGIQPKTVLEIGAEARPDTLLTLPALAGAKRFAINQEPQTFDDPGVTFLNRSAHDPIFPADFFGLILCNSVFEHDPQFWLALAEIRRILAPAGLLVVGTPGYSSRLDLDRERTVTMTMHDCPGDYYRFSPQAFRDVIFAGFRDVELMDIMEPPRIIGSGRKC